MQSMENQHKHENKKRERQLTALKERAQQLLTDKNRTGAGIELSYCLMRGDGRRSQWRNETSVNRWIEKLFLTDSFLLFPNDSLLLKCNNLFVSFVEMKVYCWNAIVFLWIFVEMKRICTGQWCLILRTDAQLYNQRMLNWENYWLTYSRSCWSCLLLVIRLLHINIAPKVRR